MTVNRARKIAIGFYTAAAVLVIIRMLFPINELAVKIMTAGFFGCALIGFVICFNYCRCPYCHRVMGVSLHEIKRCPFCDMEIRKDSRY